MTDDVKDKPSELDIIEGRVDDRLPDPVEVDLDAGKEPAARRKGAAAGEDPAAGDTETAESMEALRKSVAAAKRQAQAAESRAVAAEQRNTQYQTREQEQHGQIIEHALGNATSKRDQAKAKYKEAFQSGDADALADAQLEMTQATNEIAAYQNAQRELARQAGAKRPEGAVVEQEEHDPVEKFAKTLAPKSAAWIRKHPDAMEDGDKLARAHHAALGDHDFESPGYFEAIEKRLYGKPNGAGADPAIETAADRTTPKRETNYAAPPRGSAQTTATGKRSITLTPQEVQTAKDLDMSVQDYAKYKMQLLEDGTLKGKPN